MSLRTLLRAELARFPRPFWLLWTAVLLHRCGNFVLPFLMLFLTSQRGFALAEAGSALSVYGAGAICAALLGGQLADRWGRRPTILLSMLGAALAVVALGTASSHVAIFVASFGFGLLVELQRPPVSASVSDLVAPQDHRSAFGHLYWAHNFGFALAPAVAGMVASRFGFTPLFAGNALVMLVCAGFVWWLVPESRPARTAAAAVTLAAQPSAWRDRSLLLFLAAFAPIPLLLLQVISVLPVLMRADGLDAASYGKIVSVNGALIVLLQPWIIARLAELPRTPVLMVAALLVGLGFFGHALADSRSAHLLAVVIWTAGEIALVPMAAGVVAELAPVEQRGRYQGAYGMTWSVAHVTGPWIATHAFAQVGVFGWGVACACVGGCSALLYAWFGLRGDRHARATLAS